MEGIRRRFAALAPCPLLSSGGLLVERIARSRHTQSGLEWGLVLAGLDLGDVEIGHYGHIYVVTPTDAIALTPALVVATRSTQPYLHGCKRFVLSIPLAVR